MSDISTLSVVIPVYNEVEYILKIISRVQSVDLTEVEKEIIVVDDCSDDGTRELLEELADIEDTDYSIQRPHLTKSFSIDTTNLRILFQEENKGKGACLRRGFDQLSGEIVVIQDADLEYDPNEYKDLLDPIMNAGADVVYGSRFLGGPHRVLYFWHYVGNKFLTLLSNVFTNLNLSDMETCYKMFRSSLLEEIEIQQNRFGFEPEFTAKIAREDQQIYEVPISYYGRTYAEGKKISWKDGIVAIWCIFRYNLFG